MPATTTPQAPVRVRAGCYHACYYAQGKACECACGGLGHQSAFRGPRSPAERHGGVTLHPEQVLGDSRPATTTPPPPSPGAVVLVEDNEPAVEDTPPPTRQEAIDDALDRIATGEFTHVIYRVGAADVRQAVILTTGTRAQEAFYLRLATQGERPADVTGADGRKKPDVQFHTGRNVNIAARIVTNAPQDVWDERGRPAIPDPEPEPPAEPPAAGVTRAPASPGRARLEPAVLTGGLAKMGSGRHAGWVRADCEQIRTTRHAEAKLAEHGITAQLGENLNTSPEFLQGMTSALLDAHQKFPHLSGGPRGGVPLHKVIALSSLPASDPIRKSFRTRGDTHAAVYLRQWNTGRVDHYLVINDYTPDRLAQLVGPSRLADGGWCVKADDSAYGMTMHELGHSVAYARWGPRAERGIASNLRGIKAFQTVEGRKGVSRYAATSAHEFFAEAFSAKHTPVGGGWAALSPEVQAGLAEFEARMNDTQDYPIL